MIEYVIGPSPAYKLALLMQGKTYRYPAPPEPPKSRNSLNTLTLIQLLVLTQTQTRVIVTDRKTHICMSRYFILSSFSPNTN